MTPVGLSQQSTDELILRLKAEIEQHSDHRRQWKEKAEAARDNLAAQTASMFAAMSQEIEARKEVETNYAEAIKTLTSIADADYRGNRSGESIAAHLFLVSRGLRT